MERKNFIPTAILYRGTILQEMALLEQLLNMYIVKYFCGDDKQKTSDMMLLIMGDERFTLGNKGQIFKIIAERDKGWYNSYVSKRQPEGKKNNTLSQDLNFVIEERNIFAHRLLDGGSINHIIPLPEGTIRFLKMKNKLSPLDYSYQRFNSIVELIIAIREHLAIKVIHNE
ncbi:MAG: hypothetical protein JKY70_15500 [Mucilaginibacter sp.]|nr:hypothetical protein [Mucilaginibacter sp.]